jgi:hypothetical protein
MSHVETNRAHWDTLADDYSRRAGLMWAQTEPIWGIFDVPQWARQWPVEEVWFARRRP